VIVAICAAHDGNAGPTDPFAPALVLDEHHFTAALTYEVNLATPFGFSVSDVILHGSPASLAPDLWYGVTPDLTVGVIHSDASIDRVPVFFEPGETICIRLESVSCPRHYHGSGVDGLYALERGPLEVALHARVLLRDVAPIKPAITLGATLRWRYRWLSIVGDPYLQFGLANTNEGNRAELWLPVTFAYAPIARASIELHTGYNTDVAEWNDAYYAPLLVRVRGRVTDQLDIGAGVGFASVLGPQNNPRERMMELDVTWRD